MGKQRSPNYPAISLRDAVEAVRAIYDKEKKTQVSGEVLAKALGYSSLSGNARVKIAALKKYGLLEGDERKGMRVSDLAVRILYPHSDEDRQQSLRNAAFRPETFSTLFADFSDASDEAMRSHLINKLDFSPLGAKQLIAAFRDTVDFSEVDKASYTEAETSDKKEADFMQQSHQLASTEVTAKTGETWVWPLSKPREVKAELRITGDFTRADLDRLKRQIDILGEDLEDQTTRAAN